MILGVGIDIYMVYEDYYILLTHHRAAIGPQTLIRPPHGGEQPYVLRDVTDRLSLATTHTVYILDSA